MPLSDDVKDYLTNHAVGRRFSGNALGGARDSLFDEAKFNELIGAAVANALPRATADTDKNLNAFVDHLNALYMTEVVGARAVRRTEFIPMPAPNTPDLAGQTVVSVISLAGLGRVMSRPDYDRLSAAGLALRLDGKVDDEPEFWRAWNTLGVDERSFTLPDDGGLGRPILWFTTQSCLSEAKARCLHALDPLSLAESLCSRNGLGHQPAGAWVALLTIPGDVVQRAGHFRPVFYDGGIGEKCWFMARSSDHGRFGGGPWGQTCHLESLRDGDATYDGAHERVSLQIRREHLDSARIEFDVLGPIDARFGTVAAMARLTDGIWERRNI